jgi:predicted Zn finger-like uncharacterized protein
MFTVCPKCALTLVVTAQDLRVAQGYVRCGRCSNVFNAIVALTDDRGVPQNLGGASAGTAAPSTASTSIIRKAPSIADEPAIDPLEATGETEALYAEPDPESSFQEVFAEPTPPAPRPMPFDSSRPVGPISFVAPPPGPPARASTLASTPAAPTPPRKNDGEKRYSDTEGIDTYPENELEFNPDRTDLSKVFVEAAPVAFRNNAETGTFEKIVLGPNGSQASAPPKPAAPAPAAAPSYSPPPAAARAPTPAAPAPAASSYGTSASAAAPTANGSSASASSGATASPALRPAATPKSPTPREQVSQREPPARREAQAQREAPTPREASPSSQVPARDAEDQRIDSDLRSLAARLDVTASRPALKTPFAANDAAIGSRSEADDEQPTGDIYSRTKPRPRPAP